MKKITDKDIEGSIPGDAYSYMKPEKMEIDESKGVSCGYCDNVADGLKQAYKHYREEHKDIWENKMQSFKSTKKVGNKIIKRFPVLEGKPQEERHVVRQCATNKSICVIDFDIKVKREETEEEIPEDTELDLDLGKIDKIDIDKLNKTLRGWLKYANKRDADKKETEKEHMYSQNVGDSKMPNIIKKLLSDEASVVLISENKIGNYEVKYIKKIKDKDAKNDIFKIDI